MTNVHLNTVTRTKKKKKTTSIFLKEMVFTSWFNSFSRHAASQLQLQRDEQEASIYEDLLNSQVKS